MKKGLIALGAMMSGAVGGTNQPTNKKKWYQRKPQCKEQAQAKKVAAANRRERKKAFRKNQAANCITC